MLSTNGHGLRRSVLWAILYARVSTDEQARSGYSLAQQLEALREYAAREGYEVLEEVVDPGQSGASLERPGMDRVRDLVAAGGVAVVLAQDRDRIAREPAYHYLLRREFEEHGTKIRAMNDRGDDSPEGELTDGILDQLGKYERAKITERSRRGKLRKAREGKVIAIHTPNYGFRYNDTRDGYEVDEEAMRVVRRIFRMVGSEHRTLYAVKRTFEREGIPTPGGARFWHAKCIRNYLSEDVYKPHTRDEIMAMVDAGQMSSAVAAALDPNKRYGIWWFNRRRTRRTQVSEVGSHGERTYKKKGQYIQRPKEEWVAVPVPNSGIPREWVDTARDALKDNSVPSSAGRRVWELSGGIIKCGECGRNMMIHSVLAPRAKGRRFYYRCRTRNRDGAKACCHRKCHRADQVEPRVWDLISGLLKDPERLKAGLEVMIEQQRAELRGDPDQEAKSWFGRLAEVDQERRGYLRLAAKGRLNDEELDEVLAELEDARETAEKELRAVRSRREVLEALERDRDALLESYAIMTPAALDALSPEERHHVYKMLRLTVEISPDGSMDVTGVLGDSFVTENQDEGVVLAHYQVDLPSPSSVVALHKRVTVLDQVAQGEVFTPCPGGFVLQSPTPA
jgi:site-specific DNA recombinase